MSKKMQKETYFQRKWRQINKIRRWLGMWKRNRKRLKKAFLGGCQAVAYIIEKKSEKEI